ncbi:MAG: hypothetical protein JJU00_18905 [Opitutales bacterium]|nr:hypothetical protein [Opitutales bacterium]
MNFRTVLLNPMNKKLRIFALGSMTSLFLACGMTQAAERMDEMVGTSTAITGEDVSTSSLGCAQLPCYHRDFNASRSGSSLGCAQLPCYHRDFNASRSGSSLGCAQLPCYHRDFK